MPTSDVPFTYIHLLAILLRFSQISFSQVAECQHEKDDHREKRSTLALKSKVKALSSIARGPTLSRLQGTLKHFMAAMRRLSLSSASASPHVLRYIHIYNYKLSIYYICMRISK